MSDYGLNFGFRRSDETMRSGNEGRQKVPATGAFFQGDMVTFDPANPGYIKKCAAGDPIAPGYTGLLIQEDAWDLGVHGNQFKTSVDLRTVINDRLCSIWTGAGLKIWLKNTPATTKSGQRAASAITVVTATGLAIGDLLEWDGGKFVKATGADATAQAARGVARVTTTNGSDYVEATLLK
jgi:hypothetical protein